MVNSTQLRISGPITGGAKGHPFIVPGVDLAAYEYVHEEFFLEGVASRYREKPGTELGRDGFWQVEAVDQASFKTRLVVYRPSDPERFTGVVFVCWNNVSGGSDYLTGLTEDMVASGHAAVGVTAQRIGVNGLPNHNRGLVDWDPERYGSLSHPGDDYSYDIFTLAGRAIGPDRDRGIDPMGGLEVRKLVANGSSQSAGRLGTYINAVQPLAHVYHGIILQLYFGGGTPLDVGDQAASIVDTAAAPEPKDIVGTNLLRDDTDAKIMIVNSELEAIACIPVRQPDTEKFRWWEAAGTTHVSAQWLVRRNAQSQKDFGPGVLSSIPQVDDMNRVPIGSVEDAALHVMAEWVEGGSPPPIQPRIEVAEGIVRRDELGIALGGIRLPQVEAPLARHDVTPLAPGLISWLCGSSTPFPAEQVRSLYVDEGSFMGRFSEGAQRAIKAGVLLERDASTLIDEARQDYHAASQA